MNFSLSETIEILDRTPSVLDALLRGSSPTWHRSDEGPDTWSPFDVVGHLIHADETNWIPRAQLILEHKDARSFDPFDRFGQFKKYADRTLENLLDRFASVRRMNLRTLKEWQLTEEHLKLPGHHPALGPVSLQQLLATWAVHDLGHIGQITRTMAGRYGEDVGPWRTYLSILRPKSV